MSFYRLVLGKGHVQTFLRHPLLEACFMALLLAHNTFKCMTVLFSG